MTMAAASSNQDYGLNVYGGATVDGVTVEGTGLSNATAAIVIDSQLSNVTLSLPGDNRAVYSTGGSSVVDGTLTAGYGFVSSADPVAPDVLSRLTINASVGVTLDGGVINIDNSVIRITALSGGFGLLAENSNPGETPKTINADHLTIVGGGSGSTGVAAYAVDDAARQTSLVTLDDSIVRGPQVSLAVAATNDGAQGGPSDAQILTTYSSWDADTDTAGIGPNGTGGVVVGAGTLDDPDPLFADAGAGDFRLTPASPLVDAGTPGAGPPATDRDGTARVVDGDLDGTAVRDIGAYEYHDGTPPQTTLFQGPSGAVRDTTPTFLFSSEANATFQCRVDAAAYVPCASPFTTPVLGQGPHTFFVRALDTSGNFDPTPATSDFIVDTIGPRTTFKKKPAKQVTNGLVRFKFKASEDASTFTCSIDGGRMKTCKARTKFNVGLGKHTVKVRATDALGNRGRTAKYVFTRVQGCSGEC